MNDLNANDVEAAMRMVEGTARSMGIVIQGYIKSKLRVGEVSRLACTTRRFKMAKHGKKYLEVKTG